MKVLVSKTKIDVIHPGSLNEIPSSGVVIQAISMLCKERECVSSDSYVYIQFPFGIIDYNGLKDLQNYHQYLKDEKTKKEVKAWLSECEGVSGIELSKVKEHFVSGHEPALTNLTGKRWVSDNEMSLLFNILNKTFNDVICLVYVHQINMLKSM